MLAGENPKGSNGSKVLEEHLQVPVRCPVQDGNGRYDELATKIDPEAMTTVGWRCSTGWAKDTAARAVNMAQLGLVRRLTKDPAVSPKSQEVKRDESVPRKAPAHPSPGPGT